jgi:hypothetical protein
LRCVRALASSLFGGKVWLCVGAAVAFLDTLRPRS